MPTPETEQRPSDSYGRCLPPCGCPNCGRPRLLAQKLIEAIGSVGPESAEDAVARAIADLEEEHRLRLCAEIDMHNMSTERDDACAELKALRDRVRKVVGVNSPSHRVKMTYGELLDMLEPDR